MLQYKLATAVANMLQYNPATAVAAGDDDIPYELLKHLGPHAKEILLHMFERVWQGEELPLKWRTAVIRPLLKDGKDPKLTVSFRPISLTSCLGKLLEDHHQQIGICTRNQRASKR